MRKALQSSKHLNVIPLRICRSSRMYTISFIYRYPEGNSRFSPKVISSKSFFQKKAVHCVIIFRLTGCMSYRVAKMLPAVSESLKRADQETSALETKVVGGQPLYRIWKVRKAECGSVIGYDETAATYVNKVTIALYCLSLFINKNVS